jgi:hypothetical protein
MGVLTKNERDGLDDVFLSIQSSSKIEKIKDFSNLFFSKTTAPNVKKLLNQASARLKVTKISHFLLKNDKKKKNLSK